MIYNYLLLGGGCLLFSFLWFYKMRNTKEYGPNQLIDDFAKKYSPLFEKYKQWEIGGIDILVAIVFIFGIISIYNVLAVLFDIPVVFESFYDF